MLAARILNYRFPFQLTPVAGTLCDPNWKRISISMFLSQSSGYSQKHGCWGAWCGFLISPTSQNSTKWQVGEAASSLAFPTCVSSRELELSRHKLVMSGKLSVKGALATKGKDWVPCAPHPSLQAQGRKYIFLLLTSTEDNVLFILFFGHWAKWTGKGEEIHLISFLALFKHTQ